MYKIATAAASEPISLSEAKLHLKVESGETTDDNLISSLIVSARRHCEQYTNTQLISATWDVYFDKFEDEMRIFKSPVTSISYVKYYNASNVLTTLDAANYVTDIVSEPARVTLAYGYQWPSEYDRTNAINIRFVSGYANAAAVPDDLKSGMLLYISYLYDNRGDDLTNRPPRVIYDLWNPYRIMEF